MFQQTKVQVVLLWLLHPLDQDVLLVSMFSISTDNEGAGASVISMGVMPGRQESEKYSILQGKTCTIARHSFSMLCPKARTLLTFTCSVCIAFTLPSKFYPYYDISSNKAWSSKHAMYLQLSFPLHRLMGWICYKYCTFGTEISF